LARPQGSGNIEIPIPTNTSPFQTKWVNLSSQKDSKGISIQKPAADLYELQQLRMRNKAIDKNRIQLKIFQD